MTFIPKYNITNKLLANIKQINSIINVLNQHNFPDIVLYNLERTARSISSFASTSIEGNPLPLTEVKRILKNRPEQIRDTEREVLNYNKALEQLSKILERETDLSLNLILNIQKQVTDGLLSPPDCGKLRNRPVVVNDPKVHKIVYIPPNVEDVLDLFNDLIKFVNTNKNIIDPLILAGIFHKQMVIIHPFMDGNGRTTRLATKVLMAQMGLNTFNLFSFENFYNKNVTRYFQTVGEYGNYYELAPKIDFTLWLEYFTEGIIDELFRVQKTLSNVLINPQDNVQKHHQKILDFIKDKGYINDSEYSKLTSRARATRALDFQKLIKLNLIERKAKGKATFYILK